MGYIEDQLEKIVHDLEKTIEMHTAELACLPEGTVRSTRNDGKPVTYHVTKQNGKIVRKVVHDRDLLTALIRKEYLKGCIGTANERLSAITKLLHVLRSIISDEQILHETLARRYPDADADMKSAVCAYGGIDPSVWSQAPFKQSDYKTEKRIFRTSRGLMVRSKSEVIIAEILYSYNIPFRYEQVLEIDGISYAPDFTILCPDGTLIYWEHLGMVSSFKYFDSQLSKLRVYYSNGITLWDNLILSFDDERGMIDAAMVRNKIETRILCRR